MKRIGRAIKNFFFPPPGSSRFTRLLPYILLGILTLVVLTGGAVGWEYTNSPEFCGTSCHTMPPEYTSYLTSPHARIACVDCHIGKGFIATRITRKAGDLKHVTATLFHDYEFPIRARDLRPARETCELCHSPQKFSDDSLREIKSFANDKDNTPISTYLVLKTGGGSKREGLGRGIHWHIENPIYYLAEDPDEQVIPYVQVVNEDGSTTEYIDVESDIDPTQIDPAELKEMDCITCHNRITHVVLTPEQTVDQLISRNLISSEIPDIRRLAVEVYGEPYDSVEMGLNALAGLEGYYQTYYPEYYEQNQELITSAIANLQQAYQNSVYPEQKSDWTSHSNNIGHKNSAGCFRCHDGQHMNTEGETIRLECNLCHSIPIIAGKEDFLVDVEISRGPEPESHLNSNWITMHREVFDDTCSNCHSVDDPGGTSNTSFCSNSACHGSSWDFAGFDAPRVREVIQAQLPPTPTPAPTPEGGLPLTYEAAIAPLFTTRCTMCHGDPASANLDLRTYASTMKGSVSGPVIIPGDANASLLIQKQSGASPHFGQLTSDELLLVTDWINSGAPEK